MQAEHVTYEFAVLAMLCSAVIFFLVFPMAQGPYSVVNGPVTNLVSIRHRLRLLLGMAPVVERQMTRHRQNPSPVARHTSTRREAMLGPMDSPDPIPALRC